MHIKKVSKLCLSFAMLAMFSSPFLNTAQAGPTLVFGDDDEGILQINYKAQAQLISRDHGSGANGDESTSTMNFRRNRLQFIGAWGDIYGLYVQTDLNSQFHRQL